MMGPNTLISRDCHVIMPVSSYLINLNIMLTFLTSYCGLFISTYLGSGKTDSLSIQHIPTYKLSKIYLIRFLKNIYFTSKEYFY